MILGQDFSSEVDYYHYQAHAHSGENLKTPPWRTCISCGSSHKSMSLRTPASLPICTWDYAQAMPNSRAAFLAHGVPTLCTSVRRFSPRRSRHNAHA